MNIRQVFAANPEGLLTIFYTAGYPQLDSTVTVARHLEAAGVKLIEIGMPFSDPLADGVAIQHSSEVALRHGMNLDIMFKQVAEITRTTGLTVVLMGYLNQLLTVGAENFLQACRQAGVSGLIIPDLPMDSYAAEYQELFHRYEMAISFLITPRTGEKRIRLADQLSSGFLYLVADNSITGREEGRFSNNQIAYFQRIKEMKLSSPTLIGFGITTADQYFLTKKYANGAIIGSKFIRKLSTTGAVSRQAIAGFIESVTRN